MEPATKRGLPAVVNSSAAFRASSAARRFSSSASADNPYSARTIGAPPKLFALGKTGALHHVADLRWSPTSQSLAYTIINAQPHHHWLYVIDARSSERRELFDSQKHFLDYSWSPDGKTILLQVDDGDQWLYFTPEHPGPIGSVEPGGWRPEWCTCGARS